MQAQDITTRNLMTSLYLIMFACQFGSYRFTRKPLGVAPAGSIYKMYLTFELIIILRYDTDGRDHDRTLKSNAEIT